MTERSILNTKPSRSDSWAAAGLVFAAIMMILLGMFQAFEGLVGLINEDFYESTPAYGLDMSRTTWAWIHLIAGILLLVAGFALFGGSRVAAAVAMVLAGLAAIANFLFLPHYPIWSILIIALCVFVMWAIVRSGVFIE